jgi:hypothetical protein
MSLKDVTSRLVNDDDNEMYITTILSTTESPTTLPSSLRRTTNWDNTDSIHPLSEIDICINPNSDENNEQLFNDILTDTIEDSEEEILEEQIATIHRLLNDQNLSNNWIDQLKMYGLQADEEFELELS